MATAPTNWNALWNEPETKMLLKLEVFFAIGEITEVYTEEDLMECVYESACWDDLSIGNVTSASLTFTLSDMAIDQDLFSKETKIIFSVALQNNDVTTDYVQQGVFYVETANAVNDIDLQVVAYDFIHFFSESKLLASDDTSALTVTQYLAKAADEFSSKYGNLSFDSSAWGTFENTRIQHKYPYTSSESTVTKYIGADISIPGEAKYLEFSKVIGSVAAIAGGSIVVPKNGTPTLITAAIGFFKSKGHYNDISATAIRADKYVNTLTPMPTVNGHENLAYGYCFEAFIDDKFPLNKNNMRNIYRNYLTKVLIASIDESAIGTVSVSGAYVTPLLELGNIVSTPLADAKNRYLSFYVSYMRLNYIEGCWGEVGQNVSANAIYLLDDSNSTWNNNIGFVIKSQKPTVLATGRRSVILHFVGKSDTGFPVSYLFGRILRLGSSSQAKTINLSVSYNSNGSHTFETVAYIATKYVTPNGTGTTTFAYMDVRYITQDEIPSALLDGTASSIVVNNKFTTVSGGDGIYLDLERQTS